MFNHSDDHQRMQFYLQQVAPQGGHPASAAKYPIAGREGEFLDSTNDMASKPGQSESSSFPGSGSGPGLSPKPMRRRSRASKRTPTTVLQANTSNFRSLVQQFTGCPSTSISFNKGPVNLNFSNHNHPQERAAPIYNYYSYGSSSSSSSPSTLVSSSSCSQQQPHGSRSSFFSLGNINTASTGGGFAPGHSSMELEKPMNLFDPGFGFAASIGSNTPVRGLSANPDSLPWGWRQS